MFVLLPSAKTGIGFFVRWHRCRSVVGLVMHRLHQHVGRLVVVKIKYKKKEEEKGKGLAEGSDHETILS